MSSPPWQTTPRQTMLSSVLIQRTAVMAMDWGHDDW